ncbi:MAG: acyl dehydratase [Actinobacteria bacterium]|nr:acyl dehydratase [Actinomycetota bacterium]
MQCERAPGIRGPLRSRRRAAMPCSALNSRPPARGSGYAPRRRAVRPWGAANDFRGVPVAERLFWEELEAGDTAESLRRTVTEADVVNFCGVSGDFNWFHIDDVGAQDSVFGQRVAHGMLVTSIATGLQVEKMEPKIATAAFVGLDSWQFRAPVFIGDTIRVKRTIGEKAENEKNPKAGWCKYEIEVLNQEDKVVQRGVWNMLIQRNG